MRLGIAGSQLVRVDHRAPWPSVDSAGTAGHAPSLVGFRILDTWQHKWRGDSFLMVPKSPQVKQKSRMVIRFIGVHSSEVDIHPMKPKFTQIICGHGTSSPGIV